MYYYLNSIVYKSFYLKNKNRAFHPFLLLKNNKFKVSWNYLAILPAPFITATIITITMIIVIRPPVKSPASGKSVMFPTLAIAVIASGINSAANSNSKIIPKNPKTTPIVLPAKTFPFLWNFILNYIIETKHLYSFMYILCINMINISKFLTNVKIYSLKLILYSLAGINLLLLLLININVLIGKPIVMLNDYIADVGDNLQNRLNNDNKYTQHNINKMLDSVKTQYNIK